LREEQVRKNNYTNVSKKQKNKVSDNLFEVFLKVKERNNERDRDEHHIYILKEVLG
tara:strand:+ start:629 stop:796 length:168 start_codon:yes stop_codon:yes gene_type:complete